MSLSTTNPCKLPSQSKRCCDYTDFFRSDCLYVSIENIKNVEHFITSISNKEQIKLVKVSFKSTTSLSNDEMTAVFEALGSLPSLETIELRYGDVSMHYRALAAALKKAQRLVQLDLYCITVGVSDSDTNKDDFVDFLESIKEHGSLKEFKLSFATFPEGSSALDLIANALSNCPSMEKIQMYVKPYPTGFLSGLSSVSVEQLVKIPSLKTLKLRGIELEEEHVRLMTHALRRNKNLKELRLMNCGINSQCAYLLSNMLTVNKAIEHLDLSWNDISDNGCTAIAKALEKNIVLLGLYLHNDKSVGDDSYRALEQMLEQNFTLKTLWINVSDPDIRRKVDFYLKLNTIGKRHILRNVNASKEEWLDILVSHNNHPSGLFYYVSRNPLMFRH